MLIGTDMFLTFDKWYRFEDIFKMCTLVLAVREGDASTVRASIEEKKKLYVEKYGARVAELAAEPFPISSTELRAKIAAGEEYGAYVPREIVDFIEEKGLYR